MAVSQNTMDKFTSQDPSQIIEGLADLAHKSRDQISAGFSSLQAKMESYSKVDITHLVVANVVDSMHPKKLVDSISERKADFQHSIASCMEMMSVERIHELLASTFDVSAKLEQLKAIRVQDITPGKTIQDLAEFSDLSGAFETLKQCVASVLEPITQAVGALELNQKFLEFTQRF